MPQLSGRVVTSAGAPGQAVPNVPTSLQHDHDELKAQVVTMEQQLQLQGQQLTTVLGKLKAAELQHNVSESNQRTLQERLDALDALVARQQIHIETLQAAQPGVPDSSATLAMSAFQTLLYSGDGKTFSSSTLLSIKPTK